MKIEFLQTTLEHKEEKIKLSAIVSERQGKVTKIVLKDERY